MQIVSLIVRLIAQLRREQTTVFVPFSYFSVWSSRTKHFKEIIINTIHLDVVKNLPCLKFNNATNAWRIKSIKYSVIEPLEIATLSLLLISPLPTGIMTTYISLCSRRLIFDVLPRSFSAIMSLRHCSVINNPRCTSIDSFPASATIH